MKGTDRGKSKYQDKNPSALLLSIPFPFHIWRYCPFWGLASFRRHLNSSVSSARLLHSRILRICDISLWTSSSHLVLGFPTGLLQCHFFHQKSHID